MSDTNSDDAGLLRLQDMGLDPDALISGANMAALDGDGGSFAEKSKDEPAKAPADVPELSADDEEFGDNQTVTDQFERYADHCTTSSPETFVFDLSNKTELKAWNALQSKMILPGTKVGNLLIQHTVNFHCGVYFVIASVRTVRFRRLIP